MARFSVYENPDGGYLLDVQADLLNHLNTRMVVPLMSMADAPKPAGTLNPVFEVNGVDCVMVTQFMAAVPASILKQQVATLEVHREEIVSAIDLLMQGF
jgi:toxin CcdB